MRMKGILIYWTGQPIIDREGENGPNVDIMVDLPKTNSIQSMVHTVHCTILVMGHRNTEVLHKVQACPLQNTILFI